MKNPLSNIRVIDLSKFAAGPFGSMLLADLGAEVIKIEVPGSDPMRTVPGPRLGPDESYSYLAYNRNKKSIELDLGTELGRNAFYDLVRISDVVWDSFTPGVMERLGANFDYLKNINRRIVCCSITGWGSSGPYRERPSQDITALGASGFLSLIGYPDRPPVTPGSSTFIADISTGIYAALGVVTALFERERTGEGQRVEVNLLDATVSLISNAFVYYFLSGKAPERKGSGHVSISPWGVYPTEEGLIALGICWPRICRALSAERLIDDSRFSTPENRLKNEDELNTILAELFGKAKAEDWMNVLLAEDIIAAPVNTLEQASNDPQLLHNEMVLSLPISSGKEVKLIGQPIKMASVSFLLVEVWATDWFSGIRIFKGWRWNGTTGSCIH